MLDEEAIVCGIAGIIRRLDTDLTDADVRRMTRALAHRGPDGEGILVRDGTGFGHRRLSIIDLEGGVQPMANEDQQVWVTFNGEIYNFLDLRQALLDRGHKFQSQSDTEVIVHAYEEWGDQCVERFRGMFAFAILDLRRRRVLLARDHLGIKPLYVLTGDFGVAFASELQALRTVSGARFDLDLTSLDQFLRLQYIPAPRTVFRQVTKLEPAHTMVVGLDGVASPPRRYWRLEARPDRQRTSRDWAADVGSVIHESVKSHLVSDVPFGAFLSGGVDSSAVVAHMAQVLPEPPRTFTIGFEQDAYDERQSARVVAHRWNTRHHEEVVRMDALGILPTLVRHYGEPFGDSSAVPTYYVCKLARQHVPMVLSGDGGDEAFAGYHSYLHWMVLLSDGGRPHWKRKIRSILRHVAPQRLAMPPAGLREWMDNLTYVSTDRRRVLWRQEHRHVVDEPVDCFESAYAHAGPGKAAGRVQYTDIHTYLPNDILAKVDVASMAHGLEVRTPLVDLRVMEFAATIPPEMLVEEKRDLTWEGKVPLKESLRPYYSEAFLRRQKQGFGVPLPLWCGVPGNPEGNQVRARLAAPDSPLAELFERSQLPFFLETARPDEIWLMLVLDEWLRQNPGVGAPG